MRPAAVHKNRLFNSLIQRQMRRDGCCADVLFLRARNGFPVWIQRAIKSWTQRTDSVKEAFRRIYATRRHKRLNLTVETLSVESILIQFCAGHSCDLIQCLAPKILLQPSLVRVEPDHTIAEFYSGFVADGKIYNTLVVAPLFSGTSRKELPSVRFKR